MDSGAAKGKRGTEVPRPFGSAHKGASAFTGVCRTVDALAPVSGQEGSPCSRRSWPKLNERLKSCAISNAKAPRPFPDTGPRRRCKQPLPKAEPSVPPMLAQSPAGVTAEHGGLRCPVSQQRHVLLKS